MAWRAVVREPLLVVGVSLSLVGLALSVTPRYVARPAGEPLLVGTWWAVGVPVLAIGAAFIAWTFRVLSRRTG